MAFPIFKIIRIYITNGQIKLNKLKWAKLLEHILQKASLLLTYLVLFVRFNIILTYGII